MPSRWVLLAISLLACGPDQGPLACPVGPDFVVLITAEYGPLPSDLVLRLHYGGRAYDDPEELALAAPAPTRALFCYVADRNGTYPSEAVPLGGRAMGTAGAGGEGGASFAPGASIDALSCQLWTDGSADLDVWSQMYGMTSVKLQTQKRLCKVKSSIELTLDDAGMK